MGNKEAKFKGTGKVLGTGEVVNAPKTRSVTTTIAKPVAALTSTKPKNAPLLTEAEKQERRKAAAAAAQARERAWEERIARQRAKREEAEGKTAADRRAWNDVAPQPDLPPPTPEYLQKQKEAADALATSGFNPYQATMASSNAARNLIETIQTDGVDSRVAGFQAPPPNLSRDQSSTVEEMQKARARLQAAMKGSDRKAIEAALVDAERFDVPETEEAKDLLVALAQQEEDAGVGSAMLLDDEDVSVAVRSFAAAPDSAERKAACLATMQTLLKNLIDHPDNPKFRKIRLENKAIREKIVEPAGGAAIDVLESVGFTRQIDEDGQQCLVVPDPATLPIEVIAYARNACEVALDRLQELKL